MKKKALLLVLILSLSLIAMGCSDSKSVSTTAASNTTTDTSKTGTTSTNNEATRLFGQVESVDGSKLTIALAEQPQHPAEGEKPANDGNTKPPEPKTDAQGTTSGQTGTQASAPPQGSAPPNGGKAPTITLTGEKATVIVPDGISIVSSNRGESSENTTTMKLTDLKAGMTVQVSYTASSDGQKTATGIRVIPAASVQQQ